MYTRLLSTTLSLGLLMAATTADAKISRCTDHNGHITFSDNGCPWKKPGAKPVINNTNKNIHSAIRDVGPLVRKIHFYCHEGTKAFTKC